MHDFLRYPLPDGQEVFRAQSETTFTAWQRPRNARFITFFCVGGGGGGSAGASGASNTNRRGGSGGGGAGITVGTFPAFALPQTIFIRPGTGGAGGAPSAGTGTAGTDSYVSTARSTTATDVILRALAGEGGLTGSGALGGVAMTAGQAAKAGWGTWYSQLGGSGTAGSLASAGASITYNANIVMGGGGAGGADTAATGYAGGTLTKTGSDDFVYAMTAAPVATDGPGSLVRFEPFIVVGGMGAGGSGAGTGGRGGMGEYGAGGGGGGAGVTGGAGGRGGDGIVIVIWW